MSSKNGSSKDAEKVTQSAHADTIAKHSCTLKTEDSYRESDHEHRPSLRRHHHRSRHAKEHEQSLVLDLLDVEPLLSEDALHLFLVDKVGDPKNLSYGTLHHHVIPSYFRSGAGSVIGSSPSNRINRSVCGGKAVVLSGNRHGLRSKKERIPSPRHNGIGMRRLRIKLDEKYDRDLDAAADFLPLRRASGRKRKHWDDESKSDSSAPSDGVIGHYRSIEGKGKAVGQPDDEDLRYDSDASLSEYEGDWLDRLDEAKQRKRKELARTTEADPTRGEAWLDLINYQDEILGIGQHFSRSKITSAEKQANADVKVSMYEKAIQKVLDPEAREKLLVGLMEEGLKIWENSKLLSRWRTLLRAHPGYLGLWIKYLDHKQTTFSSFRYEEARSVFLDCLSVLQRARSTSETASVENSTLFKNQVYVLLRMTVFMREAGFIENAIAAWQAVLEWQMFRPKRFQSREHALSGSNAAEALSAFERFWESEVSRIGEECATGWANYMDSNGEPPRPRKDTRYVSKNGSQLLDAWASLERGRYLQSRIVARTIDEVDESDPYRVILFSDVGGALIDPPASLSDFALLFQALLAFCHLPPFSTEQTNNCTTLWRRNHFLRNEILHQSNNASSGCRVQGIRDMEDVPGTDGLATGLSVNMSHQNDPFSFSMPDYQISSESLFAAHGTWFSAFGPWHHDFSGDSGPVEVAWIRRTLKALVQCAPSEDYLAEYYLAFEMRFSPETAKKVAKGMIKARSDSIRLYNAYALIEYRLGNISIAENVLATAINLGRGLGETARRDTVKLWHTWIWELLSSGRTSQALRRLLMYPEKVSDVNLPEHRECSPQDLRGISPSLLLRTQTVRLSSSPFFNVLTIKQALTAARDRLLSLSLASDAILHADLLILLTYLTTSSLSSSLSTFKQNLTLFPISSPARELLHQSFSKLLYQHTRNTPLFSPSIVRSSLAESIQAYPKNTIFLSLYAWIECRFRIDDRVRSIMKDIVFTSQPSPDRREDRPSVISHFFAVHTELRRSLALGSNTHTIRATFERAVREDSVGAHSAGLWKLYFGFERDRGDGKKAREVFWRGVRACPWAKELYLLAFDGQGKMEMGKVELRGVVEMMEEKELRIHKGIEDVREQLAAGTGLPR